MGFQAPIRSSDFIFLKYMWCFEYLSCLSYKSTVSLCFPNRHIGVKSLLLVCLDQNFILINIFECNPSHSFFFPLVCHSSYGILVLLPGIRPRPPAVEKHGVLTTGPPGNSQCFPSLMLRHYVGNGL